MDINGNWVLNFREINEYDAAGNNTFFQKDMIYTPTNTFQPQIKMIKAYDANKNITLDEIV